MTKQKGVTLWFTGLSGAGKTTIAVDLEIKLRQQGYKVERLDGDETRKYLCHDLGFSKEDRDENIQRVSYVAKLLTKNDIITLCCFISPYREARKKARALIGDFIEIYINAPQEVCEQRDVKGLYAKARAGEIANFTGISDIYEPPAKPEIVLKTDQISVDDAVHRIIDYLHQYNFLQ